MKPQPSDTKFVLFALANCHNQPQAMIELVTYLNSSMHNYRLGKQDDEIINLRKQNSKQRSKTRLRNVMAENEDVLNAFCGISPNLDQNLNPNLNVDGAIESEDLDPNTTIYDETESWETDSSDWEGGSQKIEPVNTYIKSNDSLIYDENKVWENLQNWRKTTKESSLLQYDSKRLHEIKSIGFNDKKFINKLKNLSIYKEIQPGLGIDTLEKNKVIQIQKENKQILDAFCSSQLKPNLNTKDCLSFW